jgi:hypothetical protein
VISMLIVGSKLGWLFAMDLSWYGRDTIASTQAHWQATGTS